MGALPAAPVGGGVLPLPAVVIGGTVGAGAAAPALPVPGVLPGVAGGVALPGLGPAETKAPLPAAFGGATVGEVFCESLVASSSLEQAARMPMIERLRRSQRLRVSIFPPWFTDPDSPTGRVRSMRKRYITF